MTKRLVVDDIRESLREALSYAAGERTRAVVHDVTPNATDAREARLRLGISERKKGRRAD